MAEIADHLISSAKVIKKYEFRVMIHNSAFNFIFNFSYNYDYCFIRRLNIIVIIGKIKYEVK
ncbi:hypothetical protein, partial [Proteiniphilum sp. UBA5431]|uniref:hypothetical protein n=1 Tax=Proteiniphilum sp. UBA5431 TaxID=1947280 RepID=UPI00257F53D4